MEKKNIKKLYYNRDYVAKPYYINQYRIKYLKKIFRKYGFSKINIISDKATNMRLLEVYPTIKRKFYILQGLK